MNIIDLVTGKIHKNGAPSNVPKTVEAEEAEWLKLRKDREQKPGDLPDVSSASLGTDQEAGGAISTPSGRRKYS